MHPVNYVHRRIRPAPVARRVAALRGALEAGLEDCEHALALVRTVPMPDFVNEPIRCAALVPEDDAFFFGRTECACRTARRWIPSTTTAR